jgi:hypothetical protein
LCVANIHTNTNCNCDSLADSYPDTQRDTNSHLYGYSDDYGHGYCHCHCNSYSYRYGHCHGETNAYREAQRNAETTSYSAVTPLRELAWRFWGAHVSHVLVSASTPKQSLALRSCLDRVGKRSPHWRGRHRQHAGRVCSPEYRV